MDHELSYKPSAFYYRRALRAAHSKEAAVALGLHLVTEIEQHKQWIREHGLVPPKWLIMQAERDAKDWPSPVTLAMATPPAPPSSPDRATISATNAE